MRIGVLCSGGDAPGMNACLRTVVRSAVSAGHQVVGVYRGYQGLLDEDFFVGADGQATMNARSVSDLSKLGGTILRSSRSEAFRAARTGKGRRDSAKTRHRRTHPDRRRRDLPRGCGPDQALERPDRRLPRHDR